MSRVSNSKCGESLFNVEVHERIPIIGALAHFMVP